MSQINYFYEDTDFIINNQEAYTNWIIKSVKSENHTIQSINYIFCSDEYLLQINREYLKHDYYTDIITFNNSKINEKIESDIFISIDRVKENAYSNDSSFEKELSRVMIHGILHLVGYNDKSKEQQKKIRVKENAYISLFDF